MSSKSNPLYEYYKEMKKIKEYERNIVGTIVLSIIVIIGTVITTAKTVNLKYIL